MKGAYITMEFPATTETFASNDVLTLKKLGLDISVFSLKPKHKKQAAMIHERELKDLYIFNCTLKNILLGFLLTLRKPVKTLDLVKWIINSEKSNIKELVKSMLLIPSSMAVYEQISKSQPDIVHLFWGHYPSIVGYLIYKNEPKILLSMFLGAYDLCLNLEISKFVAERSGFVFTHSYSNIPMLLKMKIPGDKIETVHRGIDIKRIDKAISKFSSVKGRIIAAGKLIPEKKFDLSIRFLKKLIDKDGDFYLDIVGSGPELAKLKLLTKKLHLNGRVKFYSHMTQQNLFVKMAESQFFIMTSNKQSERLPNVVKEAMYCGCVCASFRTQGLDELINSPVNGFIFDEIDKNLEDFFLLSSELQLNKIASSARLTISKKFEIEQSMLQYINKWEEGLSVFNKV